ncbi:unnamed protein product [Sphagnum troendelagicum]|uniref:mitogen-activated protein kinase kinase kinase n=1 Tax=Sphagnum troendelagicum TaxID=128251 RepID=A0ABP0V402_9BRYO
MMAATPSLALDLCKEIDEKYSVNLVESTKFSIINRNQCMILFRKLLDTQETLVTIQHKLSDSEFTSSQSSDVGPAIHGLIHVLKRVHVIFFKDCFCKDKWLETALRQGGDLKETFGEIVSDLQWYRSVLHSIVFKQVGQDGQDLAPVDCDRNLSEIDLEALSAAAKWDQEDLKGFLRELKGEPARCGGNGGYISMQCLAIQLLDKLEFQPRSSTALEKYDEGLHEGGRNKWSEWPLVLSVNMRDLRKGPLLGEGSFGSVHETDWLGETYAMKIPKHGHCTECLELEIKALAGLQHPHVIRLVGCAEEEGKHLYLMERMDKSLSKMLEDCPLPLDQRVDMMLQIAKGVRYLHSKNVVHRDLKPENILVKHDDSGPESLMLAPQVEHFWIAKVSDFGCAKEKMESMAYAGQTTNVGTTMFMAPEMYELENGVEQPERFHPMKTDVYSFALICFVVLTSESAPFPFKELMNPTVKAFKDRVRKGKRPELPPNCPVYLSDLIQQCWDGNPVKRPDFDYICTALRCIKDFLLTDVVPGIDSKPESDFTFVVPKVKLPHVQQKNLSFCCEWRKGNLLGSGSFGTVYEGLGNNGCFFAVKEVSLLDEGRQAKQAILQLQQEITLLSQLKHENIVQYLGTQRTEDKLDIFLELVSKGSLASLYKRYPMVEEQVRAYTHQILHGLKYLHDRNIIHRDIKCANLLVDVNGVVKLADFGMAKELDKLDKLKSVKGSLYWMAPEVINVTKTYGIAADIWSLGCTVLEMVTGKPPLSELDWPVVLWRVGHGEAPPIPENLSVDLKDFIKQCLEVDVNKRPTVDILLHHPLVCSKPISGPFKLIAMAELSNREY